MGELLITAGAVALIFLVWQTWINPSVLRIQHHNQAADLSQQWGDGQTIPTAADERTDPGDPIVDEAPGYAEAFGTLIIPRFGDDFVPPLAESVDLYDVLDTQGAGHYAGTQMPGGIGNFAVAAHRTGGGDPFYDIDKLRLGDSIYVETQAGWYRYVYRSLEYVYASGIGVLNPVPQVDNMLPTDRLMTLTSCNPVHTADERIIAYAVYDTWYPRADGAPAEIASLVNALNSTD